MPLMYCSICSDHPVVLDSDIIFGGANLRVNERERMMLLTLILEI